MCCAFDRQINFLCPHKPIIYVIFPFIGQLACNKVKRLIKTVVFEINVCLT